MGNNENNENNNKLYLKWDEYDKKIREIADAISNDHKDLSKVGVIGIARGGLILLGSISYILETRNIGVLSISMSGDDNVYRQDNTAEVIGSYFKDGIDSYVIVEDILVTGKTIAKANEVMKDAGKKLEGVYALYLVNDFVNKELEEDNVKVWATESVDREKWLVFPWDNE